MSAGQASTSDSRKRRAEAANAHWAKRVAESAAKVAETLAEIEARKRESQERIEVEFVDQHGRQFWTDDAGRILYEKPAGVEQTFGGTGSQHEATATLTGNVGDVRHVLDGMGSE